MKKVLAISLALLMVLTFAACGDSGSSNTPSDNNTGSSQQEQPGSNNGESPAVKNGNFDSAFDAIKSIEPENTVEEINAIMGFEGELTDAEYNVYCWDITDSESIKVLYGESDYGTIEVIADTSSKKQDGIDFSKSDELLEKVEDGISYADFIAYIGNIDGIITLKGRNRVQYEWVSNDGSRMSAQFDEDGQCDFANAIIY